MRAIFDTVAYGRYRPGTPPEGAFNPIGPYRVRNFYQESIHGWEPRAW